MIIHSTFTNGYFQYATVFLDSFKSTNNCDLKIVFTTTDLSDDEIYQLKDRYDNLVIHNNKFNYKPICEELGITEKRAKRLKKKTEHKGARRNDSMELKWKMHVAAENRVKIDIPFVMEEYASENLIAHFDIDMYFKKSLNDLFEIMSNNDFTVMFRPHLKEWRRIWICAMGIKTKNNNALDFIKGWGEELDKIPLKDKPFAYGQTSCYRVYKRFLENRNINFGEIPENFILAGNNINIRKKDALIISGNNASIGKDKMLKNFKDDFQRRKLK